MTLRSVLRKERPRSALARAGRPGTRERAGREGAGNLEGGSGRGSLLTVCHWEIGDAAGGSREKGAVELGRRLPINAQANVKRAEEGRLPRKRILSCKGGGAS